MNLNVTIQQFSVETVFSKESFTSLGILIDSAFRQKYKIILNTFFSKTLTEKKWGLIYRTVLTVIERNPFRMNLFLSLTFPFIPQWFSTAAFRIKIIREIFLPNFIQSENCGDLLSS